MNWDLTNQYLICDALVISIIRATGNHAKIDKSQYLLSAAKYGLTNNTGEPHRISLESRYLRDILTLHWTRGRRRA